MKVIEQNFLDAMVESEADVTIFLITGIKLKGKITKFDEKCLILTRDWQSQIVYKNAISTIMPDLSEEESS